MKEKEIKLNRRKNIRTQHPVKKIESYISIH